MPVIGWENDDAALGFSFFPFSAPLPWQSLLALSLRHNSLPLFLPCFLRFPFPNTPSRKLSPSGLFYVPFCPIKSVISERSASQFLTRCWGPGPNAPKPPNWNEGLCGRPIWALPCWVGSSGQREHHTIIGINSRKTASDHIAQCSHTAMSDRRCGKP